MKNSCVLLSLSFLLSYSGFSQHNDYRYEEYDIISYAPYVKLDPDTPFVLVKCTIEIEFLSDLETLYLDLDSYDETTGKGMKVDYIVDPKYDDTLNFEHEGEVLNIRSIRFKKGYSTRLVIVYSGTPKDGLIFSKSKFGNPTVFADNWPNRAHNWLACNDHPSDKAIWEVMVEVPNTYQVISNGKAYEHNGYYNDSLNRYIFGTKVEIPTKVMVIGVAEFAVDQVGKSYGTPVSSWVFPENKEDGFHDYSQAKEVLDWFTEKIDSFPFYKLANVQSKTMFGGMENAGCIFYFENSVTGKRNHEDLLAHEIAHQWFGNSASELDWAHLWLSEGFATYLTDLYILDKYGKEEFQKRLKKERNQVIRFSKKSTHPVVDHTKDLMYLLNANSYQKGAWILHMLRSQLGDEMFWEIIKTYYQKYKLSNAETNDFFDIVELVSKKDFTKFKEDWLVQPEIPLLKIDRKIKGKKVEIVIQQKQKNQLNFPITIMAVGSHKKEFFKYEVNDIETNIHFKTNFKIKEVIIDPNFELLYDEVK